MAAPPICGYNGSAPNREPDLMRKKSVTPILPSLKPIQRDLINPEGDQSAFADETAEVCRMEP